MGTHVKMPVDLSARGEPVGTEAGLALLVECISPDRRNQETVASLLAVCGAEDLRATTKRKDYAFIYAANSGMVELLAEFVERGQDINVVDDEGATALHSSVMNDQPESVRALLALGIDTTIKTREPDPAKAGTYEEEEPAQTALELAQSMEDAEMIEILTAAS